MGHGDVFGMRQQVTLTESVTVRSAEHQDRGRQTGRRARHPDRNGIRALTRADALAVIPPGPVGYDSATWVTAALVSAPERRLMAPPLARHGVRLRPLSYQDRHAWHSVRSRNMDWLRPWDATLPPGATDAATTFRGMVRS